MQNLALRWARETKSSAAEAATVERFLAWDRARRRPGRGGPRKWDVLKMLATLRVGEGRATFGEWWMNVRDTVKCPKSAFCRGIRALEERGLITKDGADWVAVAIHEPAPEDVPVEA
jgi:hypothetical protein